MIVPLREASEENDLAEQIGAGILMLVAFVALRMTLWHATDVIFRLIDLAFAPESLMIAERLNRASDPRRSVSVLLVALPVFIVAFRMFSKHSIDIRHCFTASFWSSPLPCSSWTRRSSRSRQSPLPLQSHF